MTTLDELDRRLLEAVQSDFPIVRRPYQALAEQLGSTEDELIARMQRLMDAGIVRQVGPVFNIRGLGMKSSLCAATVAESEIERVAKAVNAYSETTHNYLRNHAFNMWFTLVAASPERIDAILEEVRALPGVSEVVSLPAEKMFKINVHFAVTDD